MDRVKNASTKKKKKSEEQWLLQQRCLSMRFRPIGRNSENFVQTKGLFCLITGNGMTTTNENEGFIRAAKDITAGSVGGIAQVLTGQPFDIVKVPSRRQGEVEN